MKRYVLNELYADASELSTAITTKLTSDMLPLTSTQQGKILPFVFGAIYGYFFDDLVAYKGEDTTEVKSTFEKRIAYDISIKLPYWYRKYEYIKKLLTDDEQSLLQTSVMKSSSQDDTQSAGGSLQKTATTPTGVSTGTATDSIDITIVGDGSNDVETTGFVDKYANAQQKYANASRVKGNRSGEIARDGSIDELLKVLEKLPSSFADEVTKEVQKHFIFDYDGEEKQLY